MRSSGPAGVGDAVVEQQADFVHRGFVVGVRVAINEDFAAGRPVQPDDQPQGGGFTSPNRPEITGHQTSPDTHRQVVNGSDGAEHLG
jgi:hypothetical protein